MLVKASVLPALVPVRNQTRSVHWCVVLAVAVLVEQCCMRGSASPLRSAPKKVRHLMQPNRQIETISLPHVCLISVIYH